MITRGSPADLHERIAEALGWSLAAVQSLSFQAVRELVRPVSPKLAHKLSMAISRFPTQQKEPIPVGFDVPTRKE